MASRRCESCFKTYSHRQSLFKHKKKCKGASTLVPNNKLTKQNRQQCKMIDGERKSDEIMREIMEIVRARREDSTETKDDTSPCDTRDKNGGNLETNEFMHKVMQKFKTIENESVEDKTEMEQHRSEKKDEESRMNNRPRDTVMFEDITLNDREKFMRLFDELKKKLGKESIEDLDDLVPKYWNNESEIRNLRWQNIGGVIGDKILERLRGLQRFAPLVSLEMQMLLNFMDKKRQALNKLIQIIESKDQNYLLEKMVLRGIITEAEKNDLRNKLDKEAIIKILSRRVFDVNEK